MMLDPAILCPFSRFVAVSLSDVSQPRDSLTNEHYTIGAKVGLSLLHGDIIC